MRMGARFENKNLNQIIITARRYMYRIKNKNIREEESDDDHHFVPDKNHYYATE